MENVFDSVGELSRRLHNREISAVELARGYLERIEAKKNLNAFLDVRPEETLKQAEAADARLSAGTAGPLTGIPIAHKDIFVTKEWSSTAASRMLEGYMSPFDATVVRQLKSAGMVCLGKLNCDEFAMGSGNENSAFGRVHNPWDINAVPGGSSGGSAAAVAAGLAPIVTGTDTGGSIRQPSSFCGVTGLKPTYGTVSRYGLVAYASSLDQIGPIAKDVADVAAVMEVIAGADSQDSTFVKREKYDFTGSLTREARGLRVGIPQEYFGEGLDTEVREAVLKAAERLRLLGAQVEEMHLGLVKYAIPAYYVIACAEASSNLSRFDGVKYGYRSKDAEEIHQMYKKSRSEGFGEEVKRRILLGSFVLSSGYYDAYYLKALRTKALIKQAFDEAFQKYDMLLGPVAPTTAPRLGESLSDPLKMYLGDIYTISANLAGLPAISVPCGTDSQGLPIGMQLIGDCFQEEKLLRAAYAYEASRKEEDA